MKTSSLILLGLVIVTLSCKPSTTENTISSTRDTLIYHITMDKDTFLVTDTITGIVYYYDKYLETKSIKEGKNGKPGFSVTHKRDGEQYADWFRNSILVGTYKDYTLADEKVILNSIRVKNDTGLIRFKLPDTATQKLIAIDIEVSALYPIASGDTGWVARTKFHLLKKVE